MPPMEAQVREQRAQLIRRAESVQKIRDAQGSLDGRIRELEEALAAVQARSAALKLHVGRVRARAFGAELPEEGAADAAPAGTEAVHDAALPNASPTEAPAARPDDVRRVAA